MAKKSGKITVRKSEGKKPPAPAPVASMFPTSLQALQSEIDRLFDEFSRGFGYGFSWPRLSRRFFDVESRRGMERALAPLGGLVPSVDVAESDKEVTVTAELPGISEKDVDVTLSDDVLTIKGEKKAEREEKDKNYYMSERTYGSFERSFRLPESADPAKISADFQNGVLTVRVQKRAGAAKSGTKKVAIKSK